MKPAKIVKEPKIGDEYFMLIISDDGSHEWWIYRVRSIQNRNTTDRAYQGRLPDHFVRYVYAIAVFSWTWGKRSAKSGDYGWLDPISDDWRKKWRADEEPRDLFRTKKAAIKYEIAQHDPTYYDDPEQGAKILAKLQNMLKRA